MRKDPSLTTFIDELPSLEAAARGICVLSCRPEDTELIVQPVSVQNTLQTVNSLVAGQALVKEEIEHHRQSKDRPSNDRFVQVMQVCPSNFV